MTLLDTRPRTHSGVRSAAETAGAAAAFRAVARRPTVEQGLGGRAWYITVGPGAVKIGTRRIDTFEPLFSQPRDRWLRDNRPMSAGRDAEPQKRGAITGWSQKSRNRMRLRLGTLDYTPLFRPGRMLPKMVTLTLPHEWEWLAPSSEEFKRRLIDRILKRKFRRHWGYELQGVWKLEFQNRKECQKRGCHDPKAPHLHILMAPPSGTRPGTGETFEQWLRATWSEACARPTDDPKLVLDHYLKGVHIEDTYGLTGTDSKRIADYFVKHGVFAAKEYQNIPPQLWERSPGRYWGYWGLKVGEGEQFLGIDGASSEGPFQDAQRVNGIMSDWLQGEWTIPGEDSEVRVEVALARILRRWAKANGKHRKVRVTLPDVRRRNDPGVINVGGRLIDSVTGQILERRLTVVRGPFVRRGAGFVSVNDGVGFAQQLHRAVSGATGTSSVAEADRAAVTSIEERRRVRQEYTAALGIITTAA